MSEGLITTFEFARPLQTYLNHQHELKSKNGFVLKKFRVKVPFGLRKRIVYLLHKTYNNVVKIKAVANNSLIANS